MAPVSIKDIRARNEKPHHILGGTLSSPHHDPHPPGKTRWTPSACPPFHQRPPQNGVLTSRLTPRMPPPPLPPPPLTAVAGASLGSSSSTRSYCLPPLEKQSIDRCPWTPHCRPPPPSRRLVLFFVKSENGREGRGRQADGMARETSRNREKRKRDSS